MARATMNGSRLEELAQREEMVQEREVAVEQREEAVKKREEAVEEREAVVTRREGAIRRREGALQEKEREMKKWEQALKEKEEELAKREEALRQQTELISSSPPPQLPPPRPTTHIHQLPDKVLEKIFALLSLHTIVNVLTVCERWQHVIEDRNLIQKLEFEEDAFTTEEALCLIHFSPGLDTLDLSWRSDAEDLLDAASARCTNLLNLTVNSCNASASLTDALKRVFHSNPQISDLCLKYNSTSDDLRLCEEVGDLPDLRNLVFDIYPVSDVQMDALIESCAQNMMEEFIAHFNPCSDAHIAKLVQYWGESLRVLELRASNLTDAALAWLAGCAELRRLKLFSLSARGNGLCGLAALSHLEELCVLHPPQLKPGNETQTDHENWCMFFSQSQSSKVLRKLSLLGWSQVDDRVLTSVAAFCPQLEELEVSGKNVTVSGVREVLRCCRKLHHLFVDNMDASVTEIVPELPQLAPQLGRICIDYHAEHFLDEATLRRVQAQMPHLRIEWNTRECHWVDSCLNPPVGKWIHM